MRGSGQRRLRVSLRCLLVLFVLTSLDICGNLTSGRTAEVRFGAITDSWYETGFPFPCIRFWSENTQWLSTGGSIVRKRSVQVVWGYAAANLCCLLVVLTSVVCLFRHVERSA